MMHIKRKNILVDLLEKELFSEFNNCEIFQEHKFENISKGLGKIET